MSDLNTKKIIDISNVDKTGKFIKDVHYPNKHNIDTDYTLSYLIDRLTTINKDESLKFPNLNPERLLFLFQSSIHGIFKQDIYMDDTNGHIDCVYDGQSSSSYIIYPNKPFPYGGIAFDLDEGDMDQLASMINIVYSEIEYCGEIRSMLSYIPHSHLLIPNKDNNKRYFYILDHNWGWLNVVDTMRNIKFIAYKDIGVIA